MDHGLNWMFPELWNPLMKVLSYRRSNHVDFVEFLVERQQKVIGSNGVTNSSQLAITWNKLNVKVEVLVLPPSKLF